MVKLVILRKYDAALLKGTRSYRALALTSVMSKWYATCIILRMERAREPEGWEQLHVGGMSTVSAVRHQVLMTQLLRKTLEVAG